MSPSDSFSLQHVCVRPKAPTGYDFVSSTVSAGGEALFLFIGDDKHGDVHATERGGIGIFPKPRMPSAKPFKLAIANRDALEIAFPYVEVFPDGRVLLAGARCSWRGPDDFDLNAAIYDPKNGMMKRLLVGDGIADLAIDSHGRIWVSYFDEGVYGNFGWGHPGPPGLGGGGLVCFDDDGAVQWQFNRDGAEAFIDDCYAMNATRDEVWVYYYNDFRLCRVSMNFEQTFYSPQNIAGSHTLVVSDAAILLSSQYSEPKNTFHLLQRVEDRLTKPRKLRAHLPSGRPLDSAQIVGRGENLHVLDEDGWFQIHVSDLV